MGSPVSHLAVGLAAGRLQATLTGGRESVRLAMLGYCALSVLPDIDVVAFTLGVPYGAPFGHRGAVHSLPVAVAVGALCGVVARLAGGRGLITGVLAAAVMASHGLLDAMTDGGLGIALLWPFSDRRFFAPWRPIPVSPIGLGFFSARGLRVAAVELIYFFPFYIYALWPRKTGGPRKTTRRTT
jgi:inner membrane protein